METNIWRQKFTTEISSMCFADFKEKVVFLK